MRAATYTRFDSRSQRVGDFFLAALAVILLGYAIAGKGFAYIGVAPLYVGEAVLGIGLLAWMLTRGWTRVLRVPAALAVVPLVTLGAIRLLPGFMEYRFDAIRDAVVWGYAAFALFVATMIVSDPRRLVTLIGYYQRFIPIFLVGTLVAWALYHFAKPITPSVPGTNGVPILFVKEGDVLVHLAGVLAFWMAMNSGRSIGWGWALLLAANVALMGAIDRAGLLSFIAVMMLCVIAKPRHGAAWRTVGMMIVGLFLLYGTMIRVEVPGGKGREISFDQVVTNIKSMFGAADNNGLDSTKEWRLQWWTKIYDYTFRGPYFWTGKGFGVNLADDDGFQVDRDHALRSPHSVHMTMLARMGVPGLAAWGLIHLVWFTSIGDAWFRARRRGNQRWAALFLFLFGYGMAFVINASFDVFLEGPMGGIWFWTVYGTGVGALWTYRARPEVLADGESGGDEHQGGQVVYESSGRAQLLPAAGRGRPGLPLGAGAARVARP